MPEISIVVPVYNAATTLRKTVDSIQNQTFRDWELILIDDCSKDDSRKICEEFAFADNRIRVILHKKNLGPSAVRNTGLENAKGEFLAFVDSDDLISKDYLQQLLSAQKKYQADVIWCNFADVTVGNNLVNTNHKLPCCQRLSKELLLNLFLHNTVGLGCVWNKLYRKSFVIQNKIKFNEERVRAEDWEFNLMLFNCFPKVYAIPDVLYYYIHQNENSVMASYRPKDFNLMIRSYNLLKNIFHSNGFDLNIKALNTSFFISILGNLQLYIKAANPNYSDFFMMVRNETFQQAIENLNHKELSNFFRVSYFFLRLRLYRFFYLFLKVFLRN